jgi:glycosyltransferase involved in cell wall biosynthesis
MKISCVIHAYNSEMFLREVLRSVSWCDEIVLIDMESTDATAAIASEFGCKIVRHKNIGFADPARQFGLEQTSYSWVLAIDSDEIVPQQLAQKLREIAVNDQADAVELSFRNFFFGVELKGAGWSYRDLRVYRFYKKGFLDYGDKVHAFINVHTDARKISLVKYEMAVVHFNYLDVSHFIHKLDRYTTYEARKAKPANPVIWGLYQILRELGGRYFILGGWRDGWIGFYLSFAMAFYRITSLTKQLMPGRDAIIEVYRQQAAKTPRLSPPRKN